MSALAIAVEELVAIVSANPNAPVSGGYPLPMPSMLEHDQAFKDLIAEAGEELTMIGIEFADPENFGETITLTRDQFDAVECVYEIDEDGLPLRALEFVIDSELAAA